MGSCNMTPLRLQHKFLVVVECTACILAAVPLPAASAQLAVFCAVTGKELASTLSFLMQLSFRRVWQPYPLAGLTPREQDIAGHMAQLGLVATCKQVCVASMDWLWLWLVLVSHHHLPAQV